MTPEVNSAIRTLLAAVLAFAAGKGWLSQSTDFGSLADAISVVGVALIGVWGVFAKRPVSTEAKQVAQNVNRQVSINAQTPSDAQPPSDVTLR